MAVSLNINTAALATQRRLGESTAQLGKSFQRLSSGLRINTAGDDAAGLAISEALRTDSRVFTQGIRNLTDGVSVTNIAESTLNEMTNLVMRMQELAEQSANGTLSAVQRASLDAEAQALAKEYFRVSRVAEFNGLRLFDGSIQGGFRFQGGYGSDGAISSGLGGTLGTGTLQAPASFFATTRMGTAVELADLNNDGNLDLAMTGNSDAAAPLTTLRFGNGDGSFSEPISYAMETSGSRGLTLGDLNGDGYLDLVTAGYDGAVDGRATIRLNRGDGTFGAATSYLTEGLRSMAVELADLNNDGNLDLVTTGRDDAAVGYMSVRLGDGKGGFGARTQYATSTVEALDVELADMNGDGNLDAITSGTDGIDGTAMIRLGLGDGTFGAGSLMQMHTSTTPGLAIEDLNGDGNLDIIAAGQNDAGFAPAVIRLGNGDGTFGTITSVYSKVAYGFMNLDFADLNGDTKLDLITVGSSYLVETHLGRGDGTFESPVSRGSGQWGYSATSGDINSDGVTDVITCGYTPGAGSDGFMNIYLNGTRDGVSPIEEFSLKTKADSMQALSMLQKTMQRLSQQRGTIGALQSRLGIATSNLQVARENYDAARSQITDIDVAGESANLIKTQIVQQAAASILGQANQAPALALTLLKG